MTLCELLNQELSPELKRTCSLTWVFNYITKGIDLPWEELTHLKYMLEDITDSTKTGIVNAKRYYK